MTTYTTIGAGEIDVDSPISTSLMTKLRDNPIAITEGSSGAPKIQTAAISNGAIHQSQISTSTQDVGYNQLVSPGGSETSFFTLTSPIYTTGYRYRAFQSVGTQANLRYVKMEIGQNMNPGVNSTYSSWGSIGLITLVNDAASSSTMDLDGELTYINASPPYDIGDGEIPLFAFLRINSAGRIVSCIFDESPPWVYNGPTKATKEYTKDGKDYIRIKTIDEETGEIKLLDTELTQDIKNADMNLIPHPFITMNDGDIVALLDPVETLELYEIRKTGERLSQLFFNDYIRIDNTPITRKSPRGVIPVKFKWKDTQRKAGAMVRDRRLKIGPFAENQGVI